MINEQEYYPPENDMGETTVMAPSRPQEEEAPEMDLSGFGGLAEDQEREDRDLTKSAAEQAFMDMYEGEKNAYSEKGKALNTTSLLAALATTDISKNISYQLTEQHLATVKDSLRIGQEEVLRNNLVLETIDRQQRALGKVMEDVAAMGASREDLEAVQRATDNVLTWDRETEAKIALEKAALERIRLMAARDPVQAKVLLNNLEYGSADKVAQDFQIKLAMLRQRAEELDDEYQTQGTGKFLLNLALGMIPINFNFQRTGVIGTAGIGDLFSVGDAQRRESEAMWQNLHKMTAEEAATYLARDGELMTSIRDNATSVFDIMSDPGVAVEIMGNLTALDDDNREWNNGWGRVEILSVLPWSRLSSATRMIVGAGAPKDAARNLSNALKIRDARGPEAMEAATGVAERELVDELSVSAIRGTDEGVVPLSEPVETYTLAAEQASKEIFNSPELSSFRTIEELQDWIVSRTDEIAARIGSPLKDVHMVPIELAGGRRVYQMKFTVGKKDGFGYATAAAARRGASSMGFRSGVEIAEASTARSVPRFTSTTKITDLSFTKNKSGGDTAYSFNVVREGSPDPIPVSLMVDENGAGRIDIKGLDQNLIGPVEMRSLMAQVADEIPELKTVSGPRATGARAKARQEAELTGAARGDFDDVATVDVTKLRGQTKVVRDMSGQYFVHVTADMPEAGFLVGNLAPEAQGFISKMIGRWFQATPRISDSHLHGMSVEAGAYLNRAQRHIQEEVMGVFSKLNKTERTVVQTLGKVQTIQARWLTREERDFLTDRQWGRPATEVEHKAMDDLRLFNDVDYKFHNDAVYLDKLQKRQESVKFTTRYGEDIDEDVVIDYDLNKVPKDRVYDASRGKHYVHSRNPLNEKTLKTMHNNGYVMVTFPKGKTLPEGITVNKMLIKKTDIDISPLRTNQLAYTAGGHRMYVASVFVKQGRRGTQADTGTKFLSTPSTFRTAENIAEGRKWADTMNAARLAMKENRGISAQELDDEIFKNQAGFPTGEEFIAGVSDDLYTLDEPFEALYDRELPSMYNEKGVDVEKLFDEDELGFNGYYRTTGRMYTSHKGEILRDTTGELAEILDPFDALSRSLNQVTRTMGLYNYKLNSVERFAKTYRAFMHDDGFSDAQLLTDGRILQTAPREIVNQIESQRAAILNVLRYETPTDRMSRQAWQETTEKILGTGDNAARKLAHDAVNWWRTSDPVGAIRGFVFDSKLGMFNPGQLLIQSTTMLSAMAMSPKFGMRGMATLFPMHAYILKRGSENVLDTLTKRGVWKAAGFSSPDEFKDYARHAYKHGFMEMNGSHIQINNYGPNSHFGTFGEKATRAREQGRVFFYTAETWNRLVAYRIAWGEVTAKGLRPNHPSFNAQVLKIADDYSMNMTSESAAYWQKGVLSIPTQFWAYQMRMLDAMVGTRFTLPQKLRLIGMNLGIAGTAGVPGVAAFSEFLKKNAGGAPSLQSEETDEKIRAVLDRGMIDYINYQLTGNDILIGERIGTGGWVTEVAKSLMGTSEFGEQSFIDIAGGATLSVAKSTSKTLFDLAKYLAVEGGGGGEMLGEITKENFINVMKEVSTFSNLTKMALIHEHGMLKSNKGTVMVSGLPSSNAVYSALSFRPAKAEEIGYLLAWSKDRSEANKEIASKLRNWRQEALVTGDYEKYWKKAAVLIELVPLQERRKIITMTNSIDQDSFLGYLEEKVSDEQQEDKALEDIE